MQSDFNFSANCVFNLDDLGEFKDYAPIIAQLLEQLKKPQQPDIQKITDILNAQFQDLEHLPNFHELLILLLSQQLSYLNQKMNRQLLILLLRIMQSHFTSYNVNEELVKKITQFLFKQLRSYEQQAIDFFLYMSNYISYSQNHQQLVQLFVASVSEQKILMKQDKIIKYMKIVDKFLRNINLRNIFKAKKKKIQTNFPYLTLKLSLWYRKKGQIMDQLKKVENAYKMIENENFRRCIDDWGKRKYQE